MANLIGSLKEVDNTVIKKLIVVSKNFNKTDQQKIEKYVIEIKEYKKLKWEEWKNLLFEYCEKFQKKPVTGTIYQNNKISNFLQHQKAKIIKIRNN